MRKTGSKWWVIITAMSILLTGFFQPVVAADVLHRMLHGEQDLLVLGELTSEQEGIFNMRVIRAFDGKPGGSTIRIDADFTYFGFTAVTGKPRVGDFAVLSLNRHEEIYRQAWHMAKADSGHLRTLSLYYDPEAGFGQTDLKALQYHVNTNGRHRDFYIDGERVFARRSLFGDVDLSGGLVPWVEPGETADGENASRAEEGAGSVSDGSGRLTPGVILSALMLTAFALILFIRIRAVFQTARRMKRTPS